MFQDVTVRGIFYYYPHLRKEKFKDFKLPQVTERQVAESAFKLLQDTLVWLCLVISMPVPPSQQVCLTFPFTISVPGIKCRIPCSLMEEKGRKGGAGRDEKEKRSMRRQVIPFWFHPQVESAKYIQLKEQKWQRILGELKHRVRLSCLSIYQP